jgi:hypothetical protein
MEIIKSFIIENKQNTGTSDAFYKLHLVSGDRWFVEKPTLGNGYFDAGLREITYDEAQELFN